MSLGKCELLAGSGTCAVWLIKSCLTKAVGTAHFTQATKSRGAKEAKVYRNRHRSDYGNEDSVIEKSVLVEEILEKMAATEAIGHGHMFFSPHPKSRLRVSPTPISSRALASAWMTSIFFPRLSWNMQVYTR